MGIYLYSALAIKSERSQNNSKNLRSCGTIALFLGSCRVLTRKFNLFAQINLIHRKQFVALQEIS